MILNELNKRLTKMKNFRKVFILLTICLSCLGFVIFTWNAPIIKAQIKPLSYPEIITALNSKLPNKTFKNKTQLINFLISAINQRQVDKPLTADREDDLRQVGATDELIKVIRANSPSLPKPIETTSPTPIVTPSPTPITTPVPTPTTTPVVTPTQPKVLERLTLAKIITALNSKASSIGELNIIIANQIKQHGVDFVLTPEIEKQLVANNASVRLIAAIKENGPSGEVTPTPKSSVIKNSIGMELVLIPAGSFMMGSEKVSDQKPIHKVTINYSFYTGKYEVTQGQWEAIMGTDPSKFINCNDCPVEKVSWNEAQEFIINLNAKNDGFNYRLPSEAEWEYANRAGTTGDYYDKLDLIAWYLSNSNKTTHPVGQKQPNAFGLFDMSGNVWEWCEDIYNEKGYVGLKTDGSANKIIGNQNYKIIRGGSWVSDAFSEISANRNWASATDRGNDIGFRVVAIPK